MRRTNTTESWGQWLCRNSLITACSSLLFSALGAATTPLGGAMIKKEHRLASNEGAELGALHGAMSGALNWPFLFNAFSAASEKKWGKFWGNILIMVGINTLTAYAVPSMLGSSISEKDLATATNYGSIPLLPATFCIMYCLNVAHQAYRPDETQRLLNTYNQNQTNAVFTHSTTGSPNDIVIVIAPNRLEDSSSPPPFTPGNPTAGG